MTKEEISKIAFDITYTNQRTEIDFKSRIKKVGYFEGNQINSELYNQNKWIFIETPQSNNEKKQTIFNGDDFHKISILQL